MLDKSPISATARVKLTKLDEHGNIISTDEHTVKLTEEEAKTLWLSRHQEQHS